MGKVVQPERTVLRSTFLLAAIGGIGLWWLMEGPASAGTGAWYGLMSGIVACHFLLDRVMWRLSEPEQRAYMQERFAFL